MEQEIESPQQSYPPPQIKLVRYATSPDYGTLGKIYGQYGTEFFQTLECYYNEGKNLPYYDCIPAGEYDVIYTWSPKFGRDMFLLLDVPGRSGIRIHPANFAAHTTTHGTIKATSELLGCIALGEKVIDRNAIDPKYPTKMITNSKNAVKEFERMMAWKRFTLVIENQFD